MGDPSTDADAPALRKRAETALTTRPLSRALPQGAALEVLLHELDVHRVELQMQNEELRAAHVELSELRDRYRELYEEAPVGYVALDHQGGIRDVNRRAADLLGNDPHALRGCHLASFLSEGDAEALHIHLRRTRKAEENEGCEVDLRPASGGSYPVHISSTAIRDQLGQLCGFRSVLIDKSEIRRAEDSLRAFQARSDAVFDNALEAIVCCDANWCIEATNVAAEQLFHFGPSELVGRSLFELLPELEGNPNRTSSHRDIAMTGFRKDGTTFPLELRLGTWTAGGHHKLMAVMINVSERVGREEQLRQAQKMEAVGTLASGVAHDFNNVLQAVLGCLILARAEDTPVERARELMDQAAFAVRHGGELARGLLAFSRKQKVSPQSLRFDRILRTAVPLLERLVTERIHVDVIPGAPQLRVRADPIQVEQILMNLAANARDAMPEGGRLTIRTEAVDGSEVGDHPATSTPWLRVIVSDTGTGMDEETRTRIFEPFFTTKSQGRGTGLGLSTVFGVTKELGGRLEVESALGFGTRFTFLFPAYHERRKRISSEAPRPSVAGRTILLVEDDPMIRTSTRHHLERLGCRVIEAPTGHEALERVAEETLQIDVLLSDITLPGMMGTSLATRFRELVPEVGVLFMTANPELAENAVADAGVLTKPFGVRELAAALAKVDPGATTTSLPAPARVPGDLASTIKNGVPAGHPESPRLLIVEDDAIAGPVLAELLESEGFPTTVARNSDEALAIEEQMDLVVMDVKLPGMSGVELARKLEERWPDVPVVFMTGLDAVPGALHVIQKPIDLDEMVAVIERALGQLTPA